MRPEKESIVEELKQCIASSEFVFLADYLGLSVSQMGELRNQLSEKQACLKVVKNTYLGVALGEDLRQQLSGSLQGPTVVIAGSGDVTEIAKLVKKFKAGNELPSVKSGCLKNKVLSSEDFDAMADLPSREIMLGRAVGTIAAPMTQLVGVMSAKTRSLLYVLKAIEDKKQNAA